MEDMGKIIMSVAIFLLLVGAVITLIGKLGIPRLPGDIFIKRGNFTFYFPIVTSIILSVILSLLLRFFRR